jgi:hypothetical protein
MERKLNRNNNVNENEKFYVIKNESEQLNRELHKNDSEIFQIH